MKKKDVLLSLGFNQDAGHREGNVGSFYKLCVTTIAFDEEGDGYSRLGHVDLSKYGFQEVAHRFSWQHVAA